MRNHFRKYYRLLGFLAILAASLSTNLSFKIFFGFIVIGLLMDFYRVKVKKFINYLRNNKKEVFRAIGIAAAIVAIVTDNYELKVGCGVTAFLIGVMFLANRANYRLNLRLIRRNFKKPTA